MKKSAKTLDMEQRLLASLSSDADRKEMRAMLDLLWQKSIELARLRIERDKAVREYHGATRALFAGKKRK